MTTSTDRDALLNAIIAEPASDLHRLVYADWLEEHGDQERSDFIRFDLDAEFHKADGLPTHKIEYHRDAGVWPYRDWPDSMHSLLGLNCRGIVCIGGHRGISWEWSRGFISRVEGPLAVLMGGECRVCEKVGMRGDAFDLCPNCHGTTRVPGVLERIAKEHPVEEVKTDRGPYELNGKYSWWRKEEWGPILSSHQKSNIPNVVFDKIAEMFPDSCQDWGVSPMNDHLKFTTSAAAHKALSDAMIALARGETITTKEKAGS
jgi:uncharacterized protein (TIGR02996 family)